MLKNYNYDIVRQLSEISCSLWRIKEYKKNAKGCDCCVKLWNTLEKDFEKISKLLIKELKDHIKEDYFE
jgi:hypothetical protein